MTIQFHPDIEQLAEYSAGTIQSSVGLCISVHLEQCEHCRQQLAKLDSVGGLMFEQQQPQSVNPALLDQIFARIDSKEQSTAASVSVAVVEDDIIPSAVKKLIGYDMDTLKWRRHGLKVRSAELINQEGIKASLLRIQKGAAIPSHNHDGREYTVILDGSFSDADGVYRRGDFVIREPGDSHAPTATIDRDCICLVTLEGSLKFDNPLVEFFNQRAPL